jgi:hypothetical protein
MANGEDESRRVNLLPTGLVVVQRPRLEASGSHCGYAGCVMVSELLFPMASGSAFPPC